MIHPAPPVDDRSARLRAARDARGGMARNGGHGTSCHSGGHDSHVTFQGQARIRFRESGGLPVGGTGHQPSRHMGDFIDARTNRMAKILRRFNMGRHR